MMNSSPAQEKLVDDALDLFAPLTRLTPKMRAGLRSLILEGRYVAAGHRWRKLVDRAGTNADKARALSLWSSVMYVCSELDQHQLVEYRAHISRLARAHQAEPTVPDLGGGAPGDRYQL
jgi:hypothetical protein